MSKLSSNEARRRRIAHEMAISPRCRFCGCEVRMVTATGRDPIPDDAAQMCRLWPKDDPRNLAIPQHQPRTALSCRKCACERHADFEAERPIDELRWRSGFYDEAHRLNRHGDRGEDRKVRCA